MKRTKEMPTTTHTGSLNDWFDSIHYQRLYGHRNQTEAASFIDALIRQLDLAMEARLLDVGCGTGRHAKHLASKGFQVTGFDLAAASLRKAREAEQPGLQFFQHDMRRPFGKTKFDYVFNFFTSFGYFDSRAEHLAALRNMADCLTSDGALVLDYMNVYNVEAHLVPREVKEIDKFAYHITRWSDRNHIFKKIRVEPAEFGESYEYVERVAKFTLQHFEQMLEQCGLEISEVYGDYALKPYHMFDSPRLILVARRSETSDTIALRMNGEFESTDTVRNCAM
jgi:SAM-dependent methyltransferase